eukprot:357205-Chlamydomonas_euryale.AAC.2
MMRVRQRGGARCSSVKVTPVARHTSPKRGMSACLRMKSFAWCEMSSHVASEKLSGAYCRCTAARHPGGDVRQDRASQQRKCVRRCGIKTKPDATLHVPGPVPRPLGVSMEACTTPPPHLDVVEDVSLVLAVEWRVAAQRDEGHNAKAPDVTLTAVPLAVEHLGGHIVGRAHLACGKACKCASVQVWKCGSGGNARGCVTGDRRAPGQRPAESMVVG